MQMKRIDVAALERAADGPGLVRQELGDEISL